MLAREFIKEALAPGLGDPAGPHGHATGEGRWFGRSAYWNRT
jgi:hypothetical protein